MNRQSLIPFDGVDSIDPCSNTVQQSPTINNTVERLTLHSAPEAFGIFSAMTFRSMPRKRFILREWMPIISMRDVSVGCGNSIFRSIRPGRKSAGSRMSIRFVAITTWQYASQDTAGGGPSSLLL